ncbi:MAG: hypothetical protein IKD69_15775 [Solobacterium sp.]|nr:hypothetical protein [Solobacterium sp.]
MNMIDEFLFKKRTGFLFRIATQSCIADYLPLLLFLIYVLLRSFFVKNELVLEAWAIVILGVMLCLLTKWFTVHTDTVYTKQSVSWMTIYALWIAFNL